VGVMLGDVSLHGFPSALIMTLTMSAAGIYAREAESPAQVLRKLDDALAEELANTEMFLTVFYGVIDPAAGVLTYANAGHPHAFAIRKDGTPERLTATDPPLGFAGPDSYGEESVVWSEQEDLLFLFTDGLSDTLPTRGLKNGESQVLDAVIEYRFRRPTEIIEALFELSPDAHLSTLGDDRTALVVRGRRPS
jgi:sigma-B regulation protein RsbU (phosphoserine phosphatase)